MWCAETWSWQGTSAQVVTVLTHIVNPLQWRLLTRGFTPETSFKSCLLFLCLAGLGALLQLLFLSPRGWRSFAQDGLAAETFEWSPFC